MLWKVLVVGNVSWGPWMHLHNAVLVWNTVADGAHYIVERLRAAELLDADLGHISPLAFGHIIPNARCPITMTPGEVEALRGGRPLHSNNRLPKEFQYLLSNIEQPGAVFNQNDLKSSDDPKFFG